MNTKKDTKKNSAVKKLAAVKEEAKKTARAERAILAIIRPNTGDLARGYTFGIQTKKHLQLVGEIALERKLNGLKSEKASAVEKICVKSLDFAEVLATGLEFCRANAFTPCRSIALYGDGAAKLVRAKRIVSERWKDLNKAVADANAALVAAATKAGGGDVYRKRVNEAATKANAAVKARDAYKATYDAAISEYRKRVNAALAVIGGFADLRKAV